MKKSFIIILTSLLAIIVQKDNLPTSGHHKIDKLYFASANKITRFCLKGNGRYRADEPKKVA